MDPKETPPLTLVIFGGSGDLTRRKLVPALYDLWAEGWLNTHSRILGVARRSKTHQEFREELADGIRTFSRIGTRDEGSFHAFLSRIFYQAGDFDDPKTYYGIRSFLNDDSVRSDTRGNALYYLATQPSYFIPIIRQLGAMGLSTPREQDEGTPPFSRVIVEKPFGRDLESAILLNTDLLNVFREEQVFRIDHYLGKETVQNILVFRLANPVFGSLWNRTHVSRVEIRVSESLGMEGRGGYFEEAGILRDMVQSHLFQVMALTAMEPPVAFEADSIRDEKVKVLRSLKPLSKDEIEANILRGQYAPGKIDGIPVAGYREEPKVAPDSRVETFVAMRIEVQNWRWAEVPFYLIAGKRMSRKATEITLHFREYPFAIFRLAHCEDRVPNSLTIRIQPNEGISFRFGLKRPSAQLHIDPADMDFSYEKSYQGSPPDAYERLLQDAMIGDSTLFARNDEVEKAWSYITPFLSAPGNRPDPLSYTAGTDGPDALAEFLGRP